MFVGDFSSGFFIVEYALFLAGLGLPIWALIDTSLRPIGRGSGRARTRASTWGCSSAAWSWGCSAAG